MFPLLLLLGIGGYLLYRKHEQTEHLESLPALPAGIHRGPRGEAVYESAVAQALLRTLGTADFTVSDPHDPDVIRLTVAPPGLAGASPILTAATWVEGVNTTHSVAAMIVLTDGSPASSMPSAPPAFLRAVPSGRESELPQGYAVILYAGALASHVAPPGAPPETVLPDVSAPPTVLASALAELPEPVRSEIASLLGTSAQPSLLFRLADELDARGFPTAAALVRRRAVDLAGIVAPQQALPPQPAPSPTPAANQPTGATQLPTQHA